MAIDRLLYTPPAGDPDRVLEEHYNLGVDGRAVPPVLAGSLVLIAGGAVIRAGFDHLLAQHHLEIEIPDTPRAARQMVEQLLPRIGGTLAVVEV